MLSFCKNYKLFHKIDSFNETELQLLFSKVASKKDPDFCLFIEILYKFSKKYRKVENSKIQKNIIFKSMIDNLILPKFKEMNQEQLEMSIKQIKIFHETINPYDNSTLKLMYTNDEFFKHLYSLYAKFDINIGQENLIGKKDFEKFCLDYEIVPTLLNLNRLNNVNFYKAFY